MTAAGWLAVIGETGVLLILLVIVGTGCAMAYKGRLKIGTAPWLRPDPAPAAEQNATGQAAAPQSAAPPSGPAPSPLGTL